MSSSGSVIVALSGGVDSAVAALLLVEQGYEVECLHMTNWEDDDGYCRAAADFQDARRTADMLGLPLHRVNFSTEYYRDVFEEFLTGLKLGETPNPDVLCNRRIKFGIMHQYVRRLGADWLATGHYARVARVAGKSTLVRARDLSKDQTYFLHAIRAGSLDRALFPLGNMLKKEVRERARAAGLPVAAKRDSTGICFIGERPFAEFLGRYLPAIPGPIVTPEGESIGEHNGLAFYTLGQRQGLNIGGRAGYAGLPWYVAAKKASTNELVVVQDHDHPLLHSERLVATAPNWIGPPPDALTDGALLRGSARTRYRQPDRPCSFRMTDEDRLEVAFDAPERAVTPGQYVVLYAGDRCLGGARIAAAEPGQTSFAAAI